MRVTRTAFAGLVLLFGTSGIRMDAVGAAPGTGGRIAAWDRVKLAVARNSVPITAPRHFRSLQLWALEPNAPESLRDHIVLVETDVTETLSIEDNTAVHIKGDLVGVLHVGEHAEVVIGGKVASSGRVETQNIAAIHVQGDMDGVVEARGMTALWIEGDLRGQVLTGTPTMQLTIGGDLIGNVSPLAQAALLYIRVRGRADSGVLSAIERQGYTELNVVASASDLQPGIHPVSNRHNGFVAVTRGAAGGS
jgi:cytoskeletal protein CcmA (bactofilin family)